MPEIILQLERIMAVFNYAGKVLTQSDTTLPLTRDIGLRFRDRTKNVLPFTSVAALTKAYQKDKILQGLFDILDDEDAIANYHPVRLSQVLLQYRKEVESLTLQDARVMTMALSEIFARTLFWHITTDKDSLDKISLDIRRLFLILWDCPAGN